MAKREFQRGMTAQNSRRAVVDTAVAFVDQLNSFNNLHHPEVFHQVKRLNEAVDAWHHRRAETYIIPTDQEVHPSLTRFAELLFLDELGTRTWDNAEEAEFEDLVRVISQLLRERDANIQEEQQQRGGDDAEG